MQLLYPTNKIFNTLESNKSKSCVDFLLTFMTSSTKHFANKNCDVMKLLLLAYCGRLRFMSQCKGAAMYTFGEVEGGDAAAPSNIGGLQIPHSTLAESVIKFPRE